MQDYFIFTFSRVPRLDSTTDQDFLVGAGHRTSLFGRIGIIWNGVKTDRKQGNEGGAGKNIVALQISILSLSSLLICFLIPTFAGTGQCMHAFV